MLHGKMADVGSRCELNLMYLRGNSSVLYFLPGNLTSSHCNAGPLFLITLDGWTVHIRNTDL